MLAHDDLRDLFDRALASERGIALSMPYGQAIRLRQRLYAFRTELRKLATQAYPPDDPAYGRSAYDALIIANPAKAEPSELIIRKGLTMEVREL